MNSAVFSPCGCYRYSLTRELSYPAGRALRRIAWLMLNPSTADCTVNDPTIKQCMAFSMLWGFDVLEVVNLFAWRATDPRELRKISWPVGLKNDAFIGHAVRAADMVMCAWGAHPLAKARAAELIPTIDRPTMCLGVTKSGMPWHPLYRPHNLTPKTWSLPA